MTPHWRPAFGKGVRLRVEESGAMLLVPEGALMLNSSAAAALELVDGTRSVAEIAQLLTARFEAELPQVLAETSELFARLAERHFLA